MPLITRILSTLRRFLRNQRGVFAISFVMMSGFLIGMASYGLEGSRFILARARLSDAMEQAALALTAEDNGPGAARNYRLASDYFRAYMGGGTRIFTPRVIVRHGVSPTNPNISYVEYRVSGQTAKNAWLYSSVFPSFDKQTSIGNNGAARKFRSNMDVMFVTDFSNSMNESFGNGSKLTELKRIVLNLSKELFSYQMGNKVGFVPFGWGGKEGDNCDFPFVSLGEVPAGLLNGSLKGYTAFGKYIDIGATVAAIPQQVHDIMLPLSGVVNACLKTSNAWKIPLTESYEQIAQINQMTAKDNTLVSSGMLLGVPNLMAGKESRKVMVIISDGTDYPTMKITADLLAAGMCHKIRRVLSTKDFVGKIAFIGINYSPTVDWKQCVGEKNFFLPTDLKALEEDLHRAIFEEVGHNILKD